jgi:hypothetical protein
VEVTRVCVRGLAGEIWSVDLERAGGMWWGTGGLGLSIAVVWAHDVVWCRRQSESGPACKYAVVFY